MGRHGMTESSESAEAPQGISLANLRPGSLIDLETRNRHYRIECLDGTAIRISGHPDYCLTPVAARLYGSIGTAGELGLGRIEPGSKVMFFLHGGRPITTSRVMSIRVDQQKPMPSRPSS